MISVLNAEIITFVKTLYFISHKISTSHTTCYSPPVSACVNSNSKSNKQIFVEFVYVGRAGPNEETTNLGEDPVHILDQRNSEYSTVSF